MANKTFLRKCIRSSLPFFRHRHSSAAEHRLCNGPAMDKLLCHPQQHHRRRHHGFACLPQPSPCAAPFCSYTLIGAHSATKRSLQLNPSSAAPLQPACFPLLPPSSLCSFKADATDLDFVAGYGHESFDAQLPADQQLQKAGDDCCKLLAARSHSCSKLQYSRPPSFKSLLCRTHSQGRLPGLEGHSHSSFINQHTNYEASGGSSHEAYARSWSSSSIKKAGGQGGSFRGELTEGAGGSFRKGKRAPKGHVAVYVDGGKERVVVPIPYLSHPCFEELLRRAESEYGYAQKGGLLLPCSIAELHDTLDCIRRQHNHNQREGHHNHNQSESHML